MPQEHFHGLLRSMNFSNDKGETIAKNVARCALAHSYINDLGIEFDARTRLSIGGVNWKAKDFRLNALPFAQDEIITSGDRKTFCLK